MSKIEVYITNLNGQAAINLGIKAKDATVGDLLESWQPLCDDTALFKNCALNNYAACKGCQFNCCHNAYVMPDIISFKNMARHLNLSYGEFIKNHFQEDKIKIGLLKMKTDPCIFLQENICAIYPFRTLICRFYLCSFMTGPVEQLIYSLTWYGITATLLFAERNNWFPILGNPGCSSLDLMFIRMLEENRCNDKVQLFMNAADYHELPLLPFLDDYTRVLASW